MRQPPQPGDADANDDDDDVPTRTTTTTTGTHHGNSGARVGTDAHHEASETNTKHKHTQKHHTEKTKHKKAAFVIWLPPNHPTRLGRAPKSPHARTHARTRKSARACTHARTQSKGQRRQWHGVCWGQADRAGARCCCCCCWPADAPRPRLPPLPPPPLSAHPWEEQKEEQHEQEEEEEQEQQEWRQLQEASKQRRREGGGWGWAAAGRREVSSGTPGDVATPHARMHARNCLARYLGSSLNRATPSPRRPTCLLSPGQRGRERAGGRPQPEVMRLQQTAS
jgi:hypothetical protein